MPTYTMISVDDFKKMLEEANSVIKIVGQLGVPAFPCGLAGVSLVRAAMTATGGDIEWWVSLLRNGPDSIVAIPLPEGTTVGKGPKGQQ